MVIHSVRNVKFQEITHKHLYISTTEICHNFTGPIHLRSSSSFNIIYCNIILCYFCLSVFILSNSWNRNQSTHYLAPQFISLSMFSHEIHSKGTAVIQSAIYDILVSSVTNSKQSFVLYDLSQSSLIMLWCQVI